jgi:plasmid stabilization system protein ParE
MSENKYNVQVSETAAKMLVDHSAFLATVNEEAADRLTDSFEAAADSLQENPQRCPWFKRDEVPAKKYRFLLFEKRYMLIFQVCDKNVYVDYVLDCRQDYSWLLN